MSQAKHTLAPWIVGDDDLLFSPNCKHYLAHVFVRDNGETGTLVPELQANAALIAAAPDLLYALQQIAEETGPATGSGFGTINRIASIASAAIAKAGGAA